MMKTHRLDQVRFSGPPASALVFRAAAQDVARYFRLQRYQDDLDDFEAAYFTANGVPLMVRRYRGNPADEYTLAIDISSANRLHEDWQEIAENFLLSELPREAFHIVWRRPN